LAIYSGNTQGGTLTVTDGTHIAHVQIFLAAGSQQYVARHGALGPRPAGAASDAASLVIAG
jgi:hypothetical protein